MSGPPPFPGGALTAWRDAIGTDHVLTDPSRLAAASTATFPTAATVGAVLRPADAEQVQTCLRIAHDQGAPLYPVSRGMNWGFGSRVPAEGHCAILDLGRMAAILDQDERLAFITVQPGVTFAQVDAFLRSAGSILFLPAIGGPPDASVIGNALERGHGIGPVPQRAAAIGAVEAVLADGRRASAGFPPGAAFRGAETHRHGIGPSLAGLFLQSNLAVVTSMTLALEPRPARLTLFHGRIGDLDALGRLLGALQPLILARALGPALCTVWNRYKRLACSGRYPWQAMDGITPLDLGRIGLAEDWEISGALYAPSAGHEAAAREALSSIGDRLQSLAYVDEDHDSFAAASPGFLGVPSPRNLSSVYWRKRDGGEAGAAPERDRCGVIQFAPLLPFGEGSTAALGLIERIVRDAGFEPQIGFDCADPRTIEAYVTIAYDRDAAGEDARALACHDALMRSLGEMGCPPYRLGVQPGGGGHIPAGSEALLALIKPALDPRCILAPGRYGIGTSGPR